MSRNFESLNHLELYLFIFSVLKFCEPQPLGALPFLFSILKFCEPQPLGALPFYIVWKF
jgi:hypothetical protein